MALPISHTPVLKGEDSRRFNEKLNLDARRPISHEERERGRQLVKAILSKGNV